MQGESHERNVICRGVSHCGQRLGMGVYAGGGMSDQKLPCSPMSDDVRQTILEALGEHEARIERLGIGWRTTSETYQTIAQHLIRINEAVAWVKAQEAV